MELSLDGKQKKGAEGGQGKIMLDNPHWTKQRVQNAGKRDKVKSFFVLTCFRPSYVENGARSGKFYVLPYKLLIRVERRCRVCH